MYHHYLIGVKEADVQSPLAQFQMTNIARDDVHKLVASINAQIPSPQQLEGAILLKSFDKWWPDLEPSLSDLSNARNTTVSVQQRGDREILEEILNTLRGVSKNGKRTERLVFAQKGIGRITGKGAHRSEYFGRNDWKDANPIFSC